MQGDGDAVSRALTIIVAAVDRYKELCEGRCSGMAVGRLQHVVGVDFSYQPPPRNLVPFAAALKSTGSMGESNRQVAPTTLAAVMNPFFNLIETKLFLQCVSFESLRRLLVDAALELLLLTRVHAG